VLNSSKAPKNKMPYDASNCSFSQLAFQIMPSSAADPALAPRKSPRQARSADTVQTILQAAARVLRQESLTSFNTNRVAEIAGVSVGSIYQYFPNKSSLMAALITQAKQTLAQDVARVVDACEGKSLAYSINQLTKLAIEQQFAQPFLAAALDHEERRLPVGEQIAQAEAQLIQSVMRLLARHQPMLSAKVSPTLAKDCLVMVKALVESESGSGQEKPPANLPARIRKALLGYLY
jgi:AcrR family transcriptional regulator